MSTSKPRSDAAFAVGATAAAVQAWRFRGALRVTVIVKATFAFAHDDVMPRVAPQPLVRDEIQHDNSPVRSVRLTTDFVPYLDRADVIFTGHVHAPPDDTTVSQVRLGLFDGSRAVLDKALVIRWPDGVRALPMRYEHAYGGIGCSDNPYGMGVAAGDGAPSIVDPADERRTSGLAPIGSAWTARRSLLRGLPLRALSAPVIDLPDDFDWTFFQAAPPDQRVPFLRGDEWIVMDGLHPTTPRARMRLPGARGLARVHGLASFGIPEGQPLALHADMLRIDGDARACTLSFRGTFPVPSEDALAVLRVVGGVELPDAPIAWPDASALSTPSPSAVIGSTSPAPVESTISLSEDDFVQDARFESVGGEVLVGTVEIHGPEAAPAPLPFIAGPPGTPILAEADSAPRRPADMSTTLVQSLHQEAIAANRLALPFAPPTPPPEAQRRPPPQVLVKKLHGRSPEKG